MQKRNRKQTLLPANRGQSSQVNWFMEFLFNFLAIGRGDYFGTMLFRKAF